MLYITIILFTIISIITGCHSNNELNDSNTSNAVFIEHQFALDNTLRASNNDIVVFHLEHHESNADTNDTHYIGTDCINYHFDEPIHVVLAVDEKTVVHSKTISRVHDSLLLAQAYSGEESQRVTLEANTDYSLCITHDESNETKTLFLCFHTDTKNTTRYYDNVAVATVQAGNDCPGCKLTGANLSFAKLKGADLSGAHMSHTGCMLTDFTQANMEGVDLSRSTLNGAIFEGTNLNNAKLNNIEVTYRPVLFDGASMIGADLSYSYFDSSSMKRVNLSHSILDNAVLTNVDLSDANLSDAHMTQTNFSGSSLVNANLKSAKFHNTYFCHSSLLKANMVDVSGHADFSYAFWIDGSKKPNNPSGICNNPIF